VTHPCPPEWEYSVHPKRKKLRERAEAALKQLRSRNKDGRIDSARDTRPVHGHLFKDLTPSHFTYFAGHYRGEPYRCLETWTAGVLTRTPGGHVVPDPKVGAPPRDVATRMAVLSDLITKSVTAADAMVAAGTLSATDQAVHIVGIACRVFDLFLQVHPYANGNGHAARFAMWAVLGRYDLWPRRIWTIEPRPPDPPYMDLLHAHRAGNTRPLVEYVLACIK
jgi:fido (protein-threonine AMPylation protein)